MTVETLNPEFWRWYLKKEFSEFEHLHEKQTYITNAENVFGKGFDLEINLETETCTDSENNTYKLPEFIAIKNNLAVSDVEFRLEVEFERWKGEQLAEQERREFFRDIENFKWYRRDNNDSIVVTEFDVILDSIIEKYNIKTEEWERYYEGRLRYLKFGRPVIKEFRLEPGQTHSVSEFSKAVWEKDFLEVKNMRDADVRSFWNHVDSYYKPRIVREFNHTGFIEFEGKEYFMCENALVKFPEKQGERLQIVAEENGAFPVADNKYVKNPENAAHLPHFDLGASDPSSGRFIKKENMLLDDDEFCRKLSEVEEHFSSMVGGDTEYRMWGSLLTAYAFAFFFLDDIYDHFKHVIFLYLYGDGNVGKGEVAKRLCDFWGVSYLSSLNTPKPRSVDVALELFSKIFVWIDEHVPEIPGLKYFISDQSFNSWFELKQRLTSIMKGNKWETERKEVRTMPLFCSNYKPKSDHLLSRCLILHYRKEVRGDERHVRWLSQEKELLQLLTLSFMEHYNKIDRKTFVWDLDRIRTKLKNEVKNELNKRSPDAILQDRQIAQFAILLTVRQWLDHTYRDVISNLAAESWEIEKEDNETHRSIRSESINEALNALLNEELYLFCKKQIIKDAVTAARHDPLTDYIESLGALVQAGKITSHHFSWTKDGHLKLWAKAVWDIYENEKRGTDNIVRRDAVEEKLKQLSDLATDGELKTVNWKDENSLSTQRVKGFYIKNAVEKEIFRIAFKYEDRRPSGAPSWYSNNSNKADENGKSDEMHLEDKAPF